MSAELKAGDLTVYLVTPDEDEVLRLVVARVGTNSPDNPDGCDLDVAGLSVGADGVAHLWTWPDGEQNEHAALPTRKDTH